MAQQPDAVFEELYISFCLEWVNPATRWQYHDRLRREWASMGLTQQQDTWAQIEQLQGALEARRFHTKTIENIKNQLAWLPLSSQEDRLNLLDHLDDEVTRSAEQSSRLLAMVEVLQGDFANLDEWDRLPHLFMAAVEGWRLAAQSMLDESPQDFQNPRAELHELKRNTPGRKVEYINMRHIGSLENEATIQASRLPPIPNPSTPPIFQHAWDNRYMGCRWECKTLKENNGGMNEGIDLMYGVNAHGTIIARAVQKKLDPSNPPIDPRVWCGDLEFGESEPILKEYATQVVTSEAAGARFVLKPLREPVNWGGNDWRLYLEYAPHSDLDTVVNGHVGENTQVPEAFLWLLFQSLIETALIMKNGVLSERAPGDWREIVHRDWKPANVCLGLPDSDHFPQYPRPRIADFGFAIFTDVNDPINPDYWVGDGTTGFFPPEGTSYIDPETDKAVDNWKMLSPSNVWGIGMVMYALMTQRVIDGDTQPEYAILAKSRNDDDNELNDLNMMEDMFDREMGIQNLDPKLRDPQDDPGNLVSTNAPPNDTFIDNEVFGYKLDGHMTGAYDPNLCDAVQKCISFHPDERPAVEQLKHFIDENFRINPTLRMLNSGASSEHALELLYRPEKERYKMGMVWNAPATRAEPDSSDYDDEGEGDGSESGRMSISESSEDVEFEEDDEMDED